MKRIVHLMQHKSVKFAALAAAAVLLATSAVYARQSPDAGGSKSYPARSTLDEAMADTAYLGPDRKVIEPVTDPPVMVDEATLARHGVYRLIPPGFVGKTTFEALQLAWDIGVSTSDGSTLEASPLFIEVAGLPENLRRVVFDSHDSTSGTLVRQIFKSDDGQQLVEVTRKARLYSPIDVQVPGRNASLVLSTESVGSNPAIVYRRSSASPNPTPYTFIQAAHGEIETLVVVRGLPESLAFALIAQLTQDR